MKNIYYIGVLLLTIAFQHGHAQDVAIEFSAEATLGKSEENANKPKVANEVVLTVRKDGMVLLNEDVLTVEQLSQKLERIADAEKDQSVRISSDADTAFQKIIDVLNVCHKAEITDISFSTRRPDGSTSSAQVASK